MEKYKLPIEQKENWCKALRGREYEQGEGQLITRDGKYCCLGVWAAINGIRITNGGDAMNEIGYQPISNIIGSDNTDKLYHMNDGSQGEQKHTFPEIADWIESHL